MAKKKKEIKVKEPVVSGRRFSETGLLVSISGKGNIDIGQRDVLNEKTITAKGDVTLETGQEIGRAHV